MTLPPGTEVDGPQWGVDEIAAYLHLSAEEALQRLRACRLPATRTDEEGPRWPATVIIDARNRLAAVTPFPR